MRVGITGANGFIGGHLVRSAVSRGYRPILFLQPGTSMDAISDQMGSFDPVYGDLLDSDSVDSFVSRCDVVFHLAGFNRYWAVNPKTFLEVNYLGVQSVAEACVKHKISKLIHVSSCITLGASDQPIPRNEESSYNLEHLPFLYGETKRAGEEEVKRWVRDKGLPAVIVNPASAVGEKDYGPTPIGKPISDISKGMWPVYVDGGACFIDVHDVVRGLWLALERGKIGEKYLLAGDNLSNQEFMSRVAQYAGVGRPRFKVPKSILNIAGRIGEWTADYVTKKHPPLTIGMSGLIGKYLYFDGKKAESDLGFKAGPSAPAIERCVKWFQEVSQ